MKLKIKNVSHDVAKFVAKESPQILTLLGIAATGATVYLTGKATWKAAQKIQHEEIVAKVETGDQTFEFTQRARIEKVWKLYIPAAATGVMAVGCIVAANRVQARRFAALAAAYGVLSGDFEEYREKASELLGHKKADDVNHELAKREMDGMTALPGSVTPDGKSWFFEGSTGRPFLSTTETVKRAMNFVNFEANNQRGASLNTFYDELGLPETTIGNLLGWAPGTQCDVVLTPVLLDDGRAVTEIKFTKQPVPNW